jgi:tetratricopeptide (TPR) repeat protein
MTSGHDMGDPGPPPDDRTIPGEAYNLFLDARRLLAERKPAEAAVALERARDLAPGFHSITELLGRAYYAGRRYDDAAEQFTAAVERDPADDYAHFALALTLMKQGRPAVAAGHLRMALAMRPDSDEYRRALRRAEAARRNGSAGNGHTEGNGHG